MKLVISVISLLTASLMSFAQVPSLKGTWENENKEFGIEGVIDYDFGGDTDGPVLVKATVNMNVNMLGLKVNGSIIVTCAGTFSYDGVTLTLTWDKESAVTSSTPFMVRYKDEDAPDEIMEKFEKSLQDLTESMKTMQDISTCQCTVSKGCLTLSHVDSDGKTVSKKYRRIFNK